MYDKLARKAIAAAIANDWKHALELNKEILEKFPQDINSLNRASRALIESGEIDRAKKVSTQVLDIDPLNTIALKCIQKCDALSELDDLPSNGSSSNNVEQEFLEEPGKTKIVYLINLCEGQVLARLNTGEVVGLVPKHHKVSVIDNHETYIGRLPDDLSQRLIFLIGSGNEYATYIKSVTPDQVSIFIRETFRNKDLEDTVSFPFKR